jgi:chorismate mutase
MTDPHDYHALLRHAREEIDRLDGEIIALLRDRLRVSAEIGRLRKERGMREVGSRDRGSLVLARYRSASLEEIGRAVLRRSASVQRQIIGSPD